MVESISHVLLLSAVRQIEDAIVCSISIQVPYYRAIARPRPEKGLRHQRMNFPMNPSSVLSLHGDPLISMAVGFLQTLLRALVAPHGSVHPNRVPREPFDRSLKRLHCDPTFRELSRSLPVADTTRPKQQRAQYWPGGRQSARKRSSRPCSASSELPRITLRQPVIDPARLPWICDPQDFPYLVVVRPRFGPAARWRYLTRDYGHGVP
jgi:hypothetical protein